MTIRRRMARAIAKVAFAVAGDPVRSTGEGSWADQWGTQRAPTSKQLIDAYTGTAYACANINAATVASIPLRLFATNPAGSRRASQLYPAKRISKQTYRRLRGCPSLTSKLAGIEDVEEVHEHPLLTLIDMANDVLDGFTLVELTDLYQEMVGRAYWYIERSPQTQQPSAIWILPPQFVVVKRGKAGSGRMVERYDYHTGAAVPEKIAPQHVIPFAFPNLKDPYLDGWSPARAMFETINLLQKDSAYAAAMMDNRARPDVFISGKDGIGPEEQKRLEQRFNRKFTRGGSGGILVGDGDMKLEMLAWPPKDMEALARKNVSKRDLANAYGVPLTFLETENVSRANAEAGQYQHAKFAVVPRLTRFCQTLNHALTSRYSDRLFLWFEDPVPEDRKTKAAIRRINIDSGVVTINEERADDGKPPVAWGEKPWLKGGLSQPSDDPEENVTRATPPVPPVQNTDQTGDGNPEKLDDAKKSPETAHARKGGTNPTRNGSRVALDGSQASRDDAWHAFPWLCDMYADQLNRERCVRLITDSGRVSLGVAMGWTEPTRLTAPAALCGCEHHHTEHDSLIELPDWHTCDAHRAAGHGRRLPRGAPLAKIWRKIFSEQQREVLRQLGVSPKAPNLDFTVDLSDWDAKAAKRSRPFIELTYDAGAQQAMARVGVTDQAAVWNIHLPEVRESIDAATMEFCKATNATTSMQVNLAIAKLKEELIAGAVGEVNTPAELSRRVSSVFTRAKRWRADRIALTESSRGVHAAQAIVGQRSGLVKGWRWLLSGDACPICDHIAMVNPTGISLADSFGTVGNNPAYMSVMHPPAHPNCMCTMTEILVAV